MSVNLQQAFAGVYCPSPTSELPLLLNVKVDVFLRQDAAQIVLCQSFCSSDALEGAVYRFPLGPKTFVCGFEAEVAGKRIVGVVKEKEVAKRQFTAAKKAGQGAYLMETVDEDRFDMKLGTIPSNTLFSLSLTFITECRFTSDGVITFTLPACLLGKTDSKPPSLSVLVHIRATSRILSVHARNHCIERMQCAEQECEAVVVTTLTSQSRKRPRETEGDTSNVYAGEDFVLQYTVQNPSAENVLTERSNLSGKFTTTHAVALSFFPSVIPPSESLVIYFVIDRSQSMHGVRMQSACQTLICALRNLPERCLFQIIGFGSTFYCLFPTPVFATPENVRKAKDHTRSLTASLEGTELSGPMNSIYQSMSKDARNIIFLITDGEVANANEVVGEAGKHPSTCILAFGVGEGVDASLLCRLAQATKGTFHVVPEQGPELKSQVMQAFVSVSRPFLSNLSLDWGELSNCPYIKSISQTPSSLRPAFEGEVFKVYAIISTCLSETQLSLLPPATVTLSGCDASGQTVRFSLQVQLSLSTPGTLLHRLCAFHAITELADGENPRFTSSAAVRDESVSLALTYSLSCQHTSFLIIEKRITPRQRDIEAGMCSHPRSLGQTSLAHHEMPWELVELVSEYDDPELCTLRALLQKPLKEEANSDTATAVGESTPLVDESLLADYEEDEVVMAPAKVTVMRGSYCVIHCSGFREFLLREELFRAVVSDLGFEHPSEVQQECIPQVMLGYDLICQAKSGMGKTSVYVLAVLQQQRREAAVTEMVSGWGSDVNTVVVCHLPELAFQIWQDFLRFSVHMPRLVIRALFPGQQLERLKEGPHIVIGTPHQLLALASAALLNLTALRHFIVDECDQILGDREMLQNTQDIFNMTPKNKQVMLFCTTLPKDMRTVCRTFTQHPVEIYVENEAKLTLYGLIQYSVKVPEGAKQDKIIELLGMLRFNQVIIFVNGARRCMELNQLLSERKFSSTCAFEGDDTPDRMRRFNLFRDGDKSILVSTDVFSRGINVERVDVVLNFDMPSSVDTYLHRIARCGRFGTPGLVITFLSSTEDDAIFDQMQSRYEVEAPSLPDQIDQRWNLDQSIV